MRSGIVFVLPGHGVIFMLSTHTCTWKNTSYVYPLLDRFKVGLDRAISFSGSPDGLDTTKFKIINERG